MIHAFLGKRSLNMTSPIPMAPVPCKSESEPATKPKRKSGKSGWAKYNEKRSKERKQAGKSKNVKVQNCCEIVAVEEVKKSRSGVSGWTKHNQKRAASRKKAGASKPEAVAVGVRAVLGFTRRDSVPKADIDAAYKNVFEDEKNMQVLKDKKNTDLLCAWQPFHFLFRRGKKLPAPPLLEDDPMAEFLLPAPPVLEDDPMAEFF